MDEYCGARRAVAAFYDNAFKDIENLQTPAPEKNSTHVFHQYTLQVKNGRRDELHEYLAAKDIPSMIYYPVPLYRQKAFKDFVAADFVLPATERLCGEVLSLPIHTEMDEPTLEFITGSVKEFFAAKTRRNAREKA